MGHISLWQLLLAHYLWLSPEVVPSSIPLPGIDLVQKEGKNSQMPPWAATCRATQTRLNSSGKPVFNPLPIFSMFTMETLRIPRSIPL